MENRKIVAAEDFLEQAYRLHLGGRIEEAIREYKNSLSIYPTAKAFTFLGWAYSLQGRIEEAISECKKAINIDPEFGNSYNDIGSYLISLGKSEEAIEWLYRAIEAKNYKARHFPYYNLGRIYEKDGDWIKALKMYNESLSINPDYESAQDALIRVTALLN